MKIAILGYGAQGKSAYSYWAEQNHEVVIHDKNRDINLPKDFNSCLGKGYLDNLKKYDLLVRSPSILPDEIVKANTSEILSKVTTPTNEFFKRCPTKNIIGVTGTKGKGTTSSLITSILKETGKNVHLGGNIGISPLELLKNNIKPEDYVVLELANFQIIDLKYSPHIAICLMITPEHLDWHETEEGYYASKQNLFTHQSVDDFSIYYAENEISKLIASFGEGTKVPYSSSPGAAIVSNKITIDDEIIIDVSEIKLPGKHNWQNVCAAVTAVWQVTKDREAIKKTITDFSGLPYRLETIKEVNGVKYINDSFGTTPETAIVALQAFSEPKIAILGGSDKGSNYAHLAENVKDNNVKHVLLIGKMADKIRAELDKIGFKNYSHGGNNMKKIIANAKKLATAGDVVLLSPGCASFALFDNYKHRGDEFNKVVRAL